MGGIALTPRSPRPETGFGLVSIVISLLIVALLSVGALKAFAGGTGTGSNPALNRTVGQAYDEQAQTALSGAMQNVRDGAISNGGLSASELAQYGVTSAPSDSPSVVSGAVAGATPVGGGTEGPLGFGSVMLAAKAQSGCWYVWFSTSATWYGFEPGAAQCMAQPLTTAPTPGPGSAGMIGWQQGSFPTTG